MPQMRHSRPRDRTAVSSRDLPLICRSKNNRCWAFAVESQRRMQEPSRARRVGPRPPLCALFAAQPRRKPWPDTQGAALLREAQDALQRERRAPGLPPGSTEGLPPANFLAISGGGDNGAFASGLLCGWQDSGTIPSFKLVTGVSTGAMIAPFAFLGQPYHDKLCSMYTTIKARPSAPCCEESGKMTVTPDGTIIGAPTGIICALARRWLRVLHRSPLMQRRRS